MHWQYTYLSNALMCISSSRADLECVENGVLDIGVGECMYPSVSVKRTRNQCSLVCWCSSPFK